MRYVIRVKRCISEIGINLHAIKPAYRKGIQEAGFRYRNTPQECATALLYNMARGYRPDGYDVVLSNWIDCGLVRREVLESIVRTD
jgi:hypothetical protein